MPDLGQYDGSVVFSVDGDNRNIKKVLSDTTTAIDKESRKWDSSVDDSSAKMTKAMNRAFDVNRVKTWGAQLGKALGKLVVESVNLASDLEEVQNVVDVTFGDDASVINKWATNAKKQFGLTETQAKRFTSTLGAMFKSAGLAGSEITGMSTDLAGLAADMASFYNLDFDTAFQKIQSGIAGQTEPLRALGISLTESNLSAFAAENGQVYKDLSDAEKIVLRYKYLMQATADAQGDFQRTSDGYANAMRLLDTNLDRLRTNLGEDILPLVSDAVTAINGMFDLLGREMPDTALDVFRGIDAETERKMALIGETADGARALVESMRELGGTQVQTDNGTTTYDDLFQRMAELQAAGGNVDAYLASLGLSVEDVNADYAEWLTITQRLTDAIPGLSEIIDDQTGAVDGGAQAVSNYIDEWERLREAELLQAAAAKKVDAYEAARANLAGYQVDATVARRIADNRKAALEAALANSGYTMQDIRDAELRQAISGGGMPAWYREFDEMRRGVIEAEGEAARAEKIYEEQATALEQVAEEAAEAAKYSAELGDTTEDVAEAMTVLDKAAAGEEAALAQIAATTQALGDTLAQIADTYQSTWEDATKDVDSAVKGFEKIVTPAQKAAQEVKDLKAQLTSDNEAEISLKISAKEGELVSYGGMMEGMQSQLDYLRTYQANLAAAREAGYDLDMLAELADGSAESADILAQLAKNTDLNSVMDLNNLWADVRAAKGDLSTDLTNTRLSADEEYQALVQSAADMIQQLDMYDGAQEAATSTVEGIVQGLGAGLSGITSQVDAILAQLARLTSFSGFSGVVGNWNLGAMLGARGGAVITPHANGLDYVPFDGYLAALHEGESILTAEEARVWRNFVSGGASSANNIDYDALGGVMRDNIRTGGNVYLNGRQVGRVLDGVQADQYRGLERSGWQG